MMQWQGQHAHDRWETAARVALITDRTDLAADYAAEIEAAGGTLDTVLSIEEAAADCAGLASRAAILVILHDQAAAPSDMLDELLCRLDATAGMGLCELLVDVAPGLIDQVAGRLKSSAATLLSGASATDRVSAVSLALSNRESTLREVGDESSTARLRVLSEEVGRIARTLAAISGESTARAAPHQPGEVPAAAAPLDPAEIIATIRSMLRARRLRDQFFPASIFSDPAWDMLLDLTASRLERRKVAVSSLCIAAAVPATTALRWIKGLTEEGLFVRRADPHDGRRVFIDLSEAALEGMTRYLAQLRRFQDLPI